MPIKHIVIGGGVYLGLSALGALEKLEENKFYNIDNIKTIYGTSVGGFIGALLCLKIDWNIILDYIIKRPWHKTIMFSSETFFDLITKKGMFNITVFQQFFTTILQSINLSDKITLQELYEYSNIELHLFTVKCEHFTLENISYKTHPTLRLVESVYMSCSYPFVFQPMLYENSYYLDGGILNNFPLSNCINAGANINEILSVYFKKKHNSVINVTQNIFEFAYNICYQILKLSRKKNPLTSPHKIIINDLSHNHTLFNNWYDCIHNENLRASYLENGRKKAILFLSEKKID